MFSQVKIPVFCSYQIKNKTVNKVRPPSITSCDWFDPPVILLEESTQVLVAPEFLDEALELLIQMEGCGQGTGESTQV